MLLGPYVFRNSLFDVKMMLLLGVVGYILTKFEIPLPPILVAFILGEIFERKIRQSLLISRGSLSIFFTRPIALAFLLLTIVVIVMLGIRFKRKK